VISENRDPDFWAWVASDPFVTPALEGNPPDIFGPLLELETTVPLASESGGFLFIRIRPGLYDLHALYRGGHARETHHALKQALDLLDPDLTLVSETANRFSRPPLTFGFRCSGANWFLTRDAWRASPAYRRR
jgi:hypothetical protein